MALPSKKLPRTFLMAVLASLRKAFFSIAITSAVISVLALTGSFFMLQVYDRVIPGHSLSTLVGIAIIAATLFVFHGALELLRSMLLAHVGVALDERMNGKVFASLVLQPQVMTATGDGMQSVRDLDRVRSFLSSTGPIALFDLPWIPLYLGLCFLFHFWIGLTATCGAIVLIVLTVLAEILSQRPAAEAAKQSAARLAFAEGARRNWEAVVAMGFVGRMAERWADLNGAYLENQLAAANVTGILTTTSRILRMMLQSAVLAVGAVLVIRQEATGGIMIASSILVSRALAPVELAIGQWKAFVAARQSWLRLVKLLEILPAGERSISLPAPRSKLTVDGLSLASPGSRELILRNMSFDISAGTILGVIGPSASGKSSLARAVTGLWPTTIGSVRLDHAALAQWDPSELGRHIGYLPQDVSLFDGSIAENIARFEKQPSSKLVVAAAKSAGVYDMIVELPQGFDTMIGEGGSRLSAGQRQRIALARALYGDPFLVVLDEPNSNLDAEGDAALTQALLGVGARGGIAMVIAHRPSALVAADMLMVIAAGRLQAFGPKDMVLGKPVKQPIKQSAVRLMVAGEDAGS
ncbi:MULTISPECIES: type I secretion system permease/ATPase [Rhizobium]|uniref:Type I secretion system permease/ATPase n=1 Tax=Rhizobium tropici TaxID=398 RepID=A0A6P1CFA1_RHITR|nr:MULTISPECIES: type I secretion system permease/ATPase [Rhizobium]AGB75530.1 RspD-like type I secretion system ATP binding cassette (ABC) protein [Rhizobium tropici CIAT 899]NEV13494.1 type I secretion system permease/ATPase [Rhizobium tropici]TGE97477.1 type I secretion system permease/ATPase [Rhizobium sp. SEMIA 4088]